MKLNNSSWHKRKWKILLYPRVVQLIVEPQDQIVQLVIQLWSDAQAGHAACGFCDH